MSSTESIRRHYDRVAESYDRVIAPAESLFFGGGREWVCSQARGEVLEIALGTGRNLPFYPEGVRLTGIELSPKMLEIARRRAREMGVEADLHTGDAQDLPFPDASFDTVVATLAFCTIPDDRRAVAEAVRVLRPGGRLLLLEHVRSPLLPVRLAQTVLNPLFVVLDGDHLLREPLRHVEAEGLFVERLERSKLGIVEKLAARKPPRSTRVDRSSPRRSTTVSEVSASRSYHESVARKQRRYALTGRSKLLLATRASPCATGELEIEPARRCSGCLRAQLPFITGCRLRSR